MDDSVDLVSICLPTYNGEKYLVDALESIRLQTYKNFEVIVSDDASKDNTLKIVQEFKQTVNFPVFIYNHNPQGIGVNWNHCIEKANGKYIKFLFQDDVLEPTCIEEMINVYDEYPNIGLVACKRYFIIDENSKTEDINNWIEKFGDLQRAIYESTEPVTVLNKIVFSNIEFLKSPLNKIGEPTTVLFKKEIIKKIGLFNPKLKQILDYEYWYRILKFQDIAIINKSLVSFRIHQEQTTFVNRNNKIDDYEIYDKILYTNYLPLLHSNVQSKLRNKFSIRYKLICFLNWVAQKIKKKIF